MPAGDIELLKNVVDSISKITDDFIVLSTHDDVDIVIPKSYRPDVDKMFGSQGFFSGIKESYKRCLYGAEPATQYYISPNRDIVIIDLHTGFYYNGLMENTYVPINQEFQEYAYSTKVKVDDIWKYRLSPESYIVHTVCRILFDKRTVMPHYKDRLERLLVECDSSKLGYALNLALFKFGPRALDLVMNKEFDNLFQEYISYSDY